MLAMIMAVAHPLMTWAHQDESVRINTVSSADASASILRGVTSNQEEDRNLAKGGNQGGGGGGNKDKDSTPQPTAAVTPAPTPTPPPVYQYPYVDPDSCGTRPPSSPAPSPAPTPAPTTPQCENPPDGQCNGKNSCCEGYSCKGKECRMNGRQLRERTSSEWRKLADCVDHRCNEYDNAPLCESDLPSRRPASNICNYGGGEYTALVQACEGAVDLCCEDGNGGYYYGLTCWISYQGGTCCPKGYTRIHTGCVPMNCCDGDVDHQGHYCPSQC
jgi:hypothetical protein